MCEACRVLELPEEEIKQQIKDWAIILPISGQVAPAMAYDLFRDRVKWSEAAEILGESAEDLMKAASIAGLFLFGLQSEGFDANVRCLQSMVAERITGKTLIKVWEKLNKGDVRTCARDTAAVARLIAMERITLEQFYEADDPVTFVHRHHDEVNAMMNSGGFGGVEDLITTLESLLNQSRSNRTEH